MATVYRYCRLCLRYPVDPRFLPNCKHPFCLSCIRSYYDHRQRGSVMRIAAFPCPDLACRLMSEVPPGGVRDFPCSPDEKRMNPEETEYVRVNPDISETVRESPKTSEYIHVRVNPEISETVHVSPKTPKGRLKKRVTFSDPESSLSDGSVSSGTPIFRSTASLIIGRIVHQQGVDIPDSALVLTTPDPLSGSDVIDQKKFPENRFRFPSLASVSSEPDINGNEIRRTNSLSVEGKIESDVKGEQTNKRWSVGIYQPTALNQQPADILQNPDPNRIRQESRAPGVTLSWRVTKTAHHKPTSMVLTPQGQAIIADYGKGTLDYLDDRGQTMLTVNTLKPFAVLLTPSGGVVVGDRRSKTLVFLEGPTAEVVSRWESGSFEWVGGLGSLRNGNLVVSDRANCRIGVYTPEGRRVTEFGSYGTGGDNLCMADFLAVDSRDRIIVSDSANHCVKVFDATTGSSLVRFSGRGSTDGQLSWPKGVCVDRLDNIIVADSKNGRLSMFSTSGDFIEHLVSGIPSPFGVCHQAESDMLGVTHYTLSGHSQCDVYRLNQNI